MRKHEEKVEIRKRDGKCEGGSEGVAERKKKLKDSR